MATMTKPGLPPTHKVSYGEMELVYEGARTHAEGFLVEPPIVDKDLQNKIVTYVEGLSFGSADVPEHVSIGSVVSFFAVSSHKSAEGSGGCPEAVRNIPESRIARDGVAEIINKHPGKNHRAAVK